MKNDEGRSDERQHSWGKEEPLMSSRVKRQCVSRGRAYREMYAARKQIQQ